MITGDKNLRYQQNLTSRKVAIVVLASTDWNFLKENAAPVLTALEASRPGSFQLLDFSS